MTPETLEIQLTKWQRLLLVFAGASGALLASALVEAPLQGMAYSEMGSILMVSPVFGLAGVLLLGSLAAGSALLAGRAWKALPAARRRPLAFGYLACAWACLLALDLRAWPVAPMEAHFAALGLGLALAAAWLITQRGRSRELFP